MGHDGQRVKMQRIRTRMGPTLMVDGGVWAAASIPEAHSRARARARARAAELGPQAAAVGWAGEIGIKTAKKPASSAFSIGPVFHPASRSRARHGENQSTNSLPPPPQCLPRTLNLPTIASSARHRSSSPVAARTATTSRPQLRHLAQPIHPPPSSSSPNRLLLSPPPRSRSRQHPQQQSISRPCPASIASEPSSPSANPQSPIQPSTTSTLARRLRSARSKAPPDASTKPAADVSHRTHNHRFAFINQLDKGIRLYLHPLHTPRASIKTSCAAALVALSPSPRLVPARSHAGHPR